MEYDFERMDVWRSYLIDAIFGDTNALGCAFPFSSTPQGFFYWNDQIHGKTPIDTATLRDMLAKYDEWIKK